jgi:flagellar FliL protein
MAEKKEALDLGEEKTSSKKWIIILATALVLLIAAALGLYFSGVVHFGKAAPTPAAVPAPVKTARFYDFEPFIVNFPNGEAARLLQISFSVLTYDEKTLEALAKHAPMLRNHLLILLGRHRPEELQAAEGKEALRQAIAQEIQKALTEQASGGSIEAVFFTQFVMQ